MFLRGCGPFNTRKIAVILNVSGRIVTTQKSGLGHCCSQKKLSKLLAIYKSSAA
jgi:hypothetical protein